jgi:hypothetical protein
MTDQTTPTDVEIIRAAMERRVAEVHTAIPASVVKYDSNTNLAQIKPEIKLYFVDEDEPRPIPVISNVPVWMFRSASAHFRLPITTGDSGLLIFCERSIDRWMVEGGDTDPRDFRKHHLSDAVFVPGLFPKSRRMNKAGNSTSAEIKNQSAYIELKSNSRVRIGNNSVELLGLLSSLIGTLETLTVSGTTHSIVGTATATKLAALRAKLALLRG